MITCDSLLLTGTTALVTGGARGIGRATAEALAALGADVAVCDRLGPELAEAHAALEAGGCRVLSAELDVRDAPAMAAFVARIEAEWGRLDHLVNNAGGGFFAPFLDVNDKGTAALVAENFTQVAQTVRACVPLMDRGGSIVNITSVEAHRAGPGFGIYSAMKAAVENLTRTLALELADRRIRVNTVAPDMIPTPGDAELAEAAAAMSTADEFALTPWPDQGHPDDVAGAVVWLCSPLSRFVTGTTVHVDGGTSAAGGWKRRHSDGVWVL